MPPNNATWVTALPSLLDFIPDLIFRLLRSPGIRLDG
jgi:hypothetical protein